MKIHSKVYAYPNNHALCNNPRALILNFWKDKVTCKTCLAKAKVA